MVAPEFTVQPQNCHPSKTQSFHVNGICLADGSARTVTNTIGDKNWAEAETRTAAM
jgi:hypothetical protein